LCFADANTGINLIKNLFGNNFLQFNLSKSNFIHFRSNNNLDKLIFHTVSYLNYGNNCVYPVINKTRTVKYLGIRFDEFLKWNIHIDKLIMSVRTYFMYLNA